jgi:hypothetical protein
MSYSEGKRRTVNADRRGAGIPDATTAMTVGIPNRRFENALGLGEAARRRQVRKSCTVPNVMRKSEIDRWGGE